MFKKLASLPLSKKVTLATYLGVSVATCVLGGVMLGWASQEKAMWDVVTIAGEAVLEEDVRKEYIAFEEKIDLRGVSLKTEEGVVTEENGLTATADLNSAGLKEVTLSYKKDDYTTYIASYPIEVFLIKHVDIRKAPTAIFHNDGTFDPVNDYEICVELSGSPTEFSTTEANPDWTNVVVIPTQMFNVEAAPVVTTIGGNTFTKPAAEFSFASIKYTTYSSTATAEFAEGATVINFDNITEGGNASMFLTVDEKERYNGDGANDDSAAKGTYYFVDWAGNVITHSFRYFQDGEKDIFNSGSSDGYKTFVDWVSNPETESEKEDGEKDFRVTIQNLDQTFRVSQPWRQTLRDTEAKPATLKANPTKTEYFVGEDFSLEGVELEVNGNIVDNENIVVFADMGTPMTDEDSRKARIAYDGEDGSLYAADVDIRVIGFNSIDVRCEAKKGEDNVELKDENGYSYIDTETWEVWAQLSCSTTRFSNTDEHPEWTDVYDITEVCTGTTFLKSEETKIGDKTYKTEIYNIAINGKEYLIDRSTNVREGAWRTLEFTNVTGDGETLILVVDKAETNNEDGDSADTRATGKYYFVAADGTWSVFDFAYYLTGGESKFISESLAGDTPRIKDEQGGGVANENDFKVTVDGIEFQVTINWRDTLIDGPFGF